MSIGKTMSGAGLKSVKETGRKEEKAKVVKKKTTDKKPVEKTRISSEAKETGIKQKIKSKLGKLKKMLLSGNQEPVFEGYQPKDTVSTENPPSGRTRPAVKTGKTEKPVEKSPSPLSNALQRRFSLEHHQSLPDEQEVRLAQALFKGYMMMCLHGKENPSKEYMGKVMFSVLPDTDPHFKNFEEDFIKSLDDPKVEVFSLYAAQVGNRVFREAALASDGQEKCHKMLATMMKVGGIKHPEKFGD